METNEVQKEADAAGHKAVAFGIVALGLAGLFGWMLAHLTSGGPETRPVVVAAAAIAPLSQPKMDQLRVVDWPVAAMPQGTFARPEDVIKTDQININGLLEGEPVLAARLSTPDKGLGMSQMVEPNKRAIVVQVQEATAKAEILHPGAVVDVIATLQDTKTHEMVTKSIIQNVPVVAVGDSIDVEQSNVDPKNEGERRSEKLERHRVVTLMVALPQAELLTFAIRYGTVDLTLRNNADVETVVTQGVTMDKVMGRKKSEETKVGESGSGDAAANTANFTPRLPHPSNRGHGGGGARAQGPSIIKINR